MSFLWKALGAVALFTLMLAFAFRVPLPAWSWAILGVCVANGARAFIMGAALSAREDEINAEIYGRDAKGKAKKPVYHDL